PAAAHREVEDPGRAWPVRLQGIPRSRMKLRPSARAVLKELLLGEDLDAQLGGLLGLAARVRADDKIVGFRADRGCDSRTGVLRKSLRLAATDRGQGSGEDQRLSGQRASRCLARGGRLQFDSTCA